MHLPPDRSVGLSVVVLVIAAACAGDGAASPSPGGPLDAQEGAQPCAPGAPAAFEHPDWPIGPGSEADFLPVIQSSLLSAGPSRFLYSVVDSAYRQLAAPDVPSRVAFFALERDPDEPVVTVEASYLSSGLGRGLYRAAVDFDCFGEWGAEVGFQLPDGSIASERLRFQVHPAGSTPAIGAAAPRSDSPTADTLEAARRISTDANPYAAAYDTSVAEAVSSGRPALILFATPAFCQSGVCGPTVELVKSVASEYEDRLDYVNVEPYELQLTENDLQPRLDADGQLQPVAAAVDYGIPVEPYLFVVDAAGDVFAKFEVLVGADELRAAIEDVLDEAG